jgi:hypothetical protein
MKLPERAPEPRTGAHFTGAHFTGAHFKEHEQDVERYL